MPDLVTDQGWGGGDTSHHGGGSFGGSGAWTPLSSWYEFSDREYGRILDIISEGPVHGPVRGLKSFFLDDTPVQNNDGTMNFSGVAIYATRGTKTQSYIPGFPASENEVSIGDRKITATAGVFGPYEFTVLTAGLTHLRIRVGCPQLKKTNLTTGQVSGATVQIKIEVMSDVSPYAVVPLANNGFIIGTYESLHTQSFKIKLPPMVSGGWRVRVTRITADANPPVDGLQNETHMYSYTEIVEARFTHPWTALAGIIVDARQFPSIPRRSFEYDGRIIKIPSNYTPARLDPDTGVWTPGSYSGNWNGTFKDSPTVCFNPAWQFFDLATNTRYGTGNYLTASKLDKWALYSIAMYCDEMVDNGMGGQEPRFATSFYLQKQEDAIKVLANIAAAFRGVLYYASGTLVPSQDKDKPVWAIFTNSNVKDGVFKYTGTARKARHTTAMVSWNDPKAGYVLTPELVEDQNAVLRYGRQQLDSTLIGCFSRAGAIRFGQYQLITEQTETEAIEFESTLEGAAVAPGRVIQINDQFRAGMARFGGRILPGATTGTVTLDAPVALEVGHTYTMRLCLPGATTTTRPDGKTVFEEGVKIEQVTITNAPGTTSVITFTPALSTAPQDYAQWLISDGAVVPALYKVIGVKETKDGYLITGLQHNPNKFALADVVGILTQDVDLGANTTPAPSGLTCTSSYSVVDGAIVYKVSAYWTGPSTATPQGYKVESSFENGPWKDVPSAGTTALIDNASLGSYRLRVTAIYAGGSSAPVTITYNVVSWVTTTPTFVTLDIE